MLSLCPPQWLPVILHCLLPSVPIQQRQRWTQLYHSLQETPRTPKPQSPHHQWVQHLQTHSDIRSLQREFEARLRAVEIASLKICRMFLPREDDVQDCLQTARQRAWEFYYSYDNKYKGRQHQEEKTFRNWYLAILKNVIRMHLRQKIRLPLLSLDGMTPHFDVPECEEPTSFVLPQEDETEDNWDPINEISKDESAAYSHPPHPDMSRMRRNGRFARLIEDIETETVFYELIAHWEQTDQIIGTRYFLEGYTCEEIAIEVHLELNTLKKHLNTLRQQLQTLWLHFDEGTRHD